MIPCTKCNIISKANYCGRCERTPYCSRECQVEHWAAHKRLCVTPEQCKKGVEMTIRRIIGNIIVMLDYHKHDVESPNPIITVRIDETIEEFIKGNCSMHIAHLSSAEDIGAAKPSAIFVFKNQQISVDLDIPPGRPTKAPQYTGGIWSIIFDM